jgi:isocitrate lyase
MTYSQTLTELKNRYPNGAPAGIDLNALAQLKTQNTYETHLDIAKAMATLMRNDMARYDADSSQFTQSLGCWSGFHAQQMMRAIKRQKGTLDRAYVYLSGWMVAGLRNRFGHLPDQSMHEKTSVVDLIQEIYTSLRQADEVDLNDLFNELNETDDRAAVIAKIDGFESYVRPIIADIDAGFGNVHATYLLAKEMIKAGACCIQIENQVSDAKQCGHQDGKVTVPREDFIEKLRAVRMAFEELGVYDGVIVARTDSLGAGLTQKLPVSREAGDHAAEYNKWLETTPVSDLHELNEGDVAIQLEGQLVKPTRLPNGLYKFRAETGEDRVVEDCIASLNEGGADLLWIETATPNVAQIAGMVNRIKEKAPHAKLTYNNSPSFNWTLNLRKQVREDWISESRIKAEDYDEARLMSAAYDEDPLGIEADRRLQAFQTDIAREAGVFHNLITLPTFHGTAKVMNDLSEGYFGDQKMLAYVKEIQREEIRKGVSAVRHQHEVGSDLGDTFKEMTGGDRALKAGGEHNTMNQFADVA